MKYRRLHLLSLFLLCQVLEAATVARYTGSRIYWDARSPVTIFDGGYARLIELQDGRLLACCESGGIKVSFSSNKGSSWTSPVNIAPNPSGVPNCVPDLIQLKDGTIIVAYNPRPTSPYSPDRRFGIRLRRSTNNGKTWSQEIFVYDADYTFENGCWEPSLLELPDGELQLYFADESPYTTSNEQQISLCRSFDGGLTWTAPQRISFRNGYRDGMPVPVLLQDGKSIVVAIEDNGWSGIGDFLPTTVRTTLSNNWRNNFYVSGESSQRNQSINYNYCPMAKGGAPYLRVLPSGETVMSHQSKHGDGDNHKMYVYVGNNQAKDFKAMSKPFQQGTTKECLWNSLAVIDTGIVVAVGGLAGKVTIVKGYPMKQFHAPYASQLVDGCLTADDTYYHSSAKQVPMGSETGVFSYTDFAYDRDMLYMTCLVYRGRALATDPCLDNVILYLDNKGASTNLPTSSAYRFVVMPDGKLTASRGNGKDWAEQDLPGVYAAGIATTTNYRIEVAVPWSAIGLSEAPVGSDLTVNIEISSPSSDGVRQVVERIPDASPTMPYTWVPLKLIQPTSTPLQTTHAEPQTQAMYDMQGRLVNNTRMPRSIYVKKGKKIM